MGRPGTAVVSGEYTAVVCEEETAGLVATAEQLDGRRGVGTVFSVGMVASGCAEEGRLDFGSG